jgi:hypothetical protein
VDYKFHQQKFRDYYIDPAKIIIYLTNALKRKIC